MTTPLLETSLLQQTVLFGQLVGNGLGATLALLLAALVWKYPGDERRARVLFALCAAVWTLGGLTWFGLLAAGVDVNSALLSWVGFFTFSAVAVWPVSVSLLWDTNTSFTARERIAATWLVRFAVVTAVLSIAGCLVVALQGGDVRELVILTAYNAAAILIAAAVLVYRHLTSMTERIAVVLIPLGPVLTLVLYNVSAAGLVQGQWAAITQVLAKQSIILTILGGLFYLGRFRGVDRFAKMGLRITLAWVLASTATWVISGQLAQLSMGSGASTAGSLAVVSAVIVLSILVFVLLGRASDHWVDRRVFGRTDPSAALAGFREQLSREDDAASVLIAAERFLDVTLQVKAHVEPRAAEAPVVVAAPAKYCDWHSRAESFPIAVGDAEPLALLLEPSERRLLVTAEVDVVRQTAHLVGRRLEALERERDRLERSRREASLVHQLVEAELRALRAQINPHFLFNSLNTIASLAHDDPAMAERMTVRLARIFRHVLTQTDRPFSSLKEEMDFVRAYLDIEQIRFGERLKIVIRVADSIVDHQVPSLILQPLVENAIKHGLSPKIGECRLTVVGAQEGEDIVLSVEDDGVGSRGASAAGHAESTGIGLRNVRERLRTLYGERGRLSFESRARQGSRAAVYVPLVAHR